MKTQLCLNLRPQQKIIIGDMESVIEVEYIWDNGVYLSIDGTRFQCSASLISFNHPRLDISILVSRVRPFKQAWFYFTAAPEIAINREKIYLKKKLGGYWPCV